MNKEYVEHTLPPQIDSGSKILILGTMPSPKSRETGFYYGHPQNRFWRLLSDLFQNQSQKRSKKKGVLEPTSYRIMGYVKIVFDL